PQSEHGRGLRRLKQRTCGETDDLSHRRAPLTHSVAGCDRAEWEVNWGVGSGEWDLLITIPRWFISSSPLPSFLHSQKPKCFRRVIIVVARRLPGDAFAVGRRALEAVEIDAQLLAGLRLSFVNLVNGDAHLAVPDFLVRRDVGLHFKARIP